jgi:hypothetical protein
MGMVNNKGIHLSILACMDISSHLTLYFLLHYNWGTSHNMVHKLSNYDDLKMFNCLTRMWAVIQIRKTNRNFILSMIAKTLKVNIIKHLSIWTRSAFIIGKTCLTVLTAFLIQYQIYWNIIRGHSQSKNSYIHKFIMIRPSAINHYIHRKSGSWGRLSIGGHTW